MGLIQKKKTTLKNTVLIKDESTVTCFFENQQYLFLFVVFSQEGRPDLSTPSNLLQL